MPTNRLWASARASHGFGEHGQCSEGQRRRKSFLGCIQAALCSAPPLSDRGQKKSSNRHELHETNSKSSSPPFSTQPLICIAKRGPVVTSCVSRGWSAPVCRSFEAPALRNPVSHPAVTRVSTSYAELLRFAATLTACHMELCPKRSLRACMHWQSLRPPSSAPCSSSRQLTRVLPRWRP